MLRNATRLQRYRGLEINLKYFPSRAQNQNSRHYASTTPPAKQSSQGSSTGLKATFGAILALTGGAVAYAKYDDEFRHWLNEQLPFSDPALTFIFQEEKTFSEHLSGMASNLRVWLDESLTFNRDVKSYGDFTVEEVVPYTAPRSAFFPLLEGIPPGPCDPSYEKPYQEIRVFSPSDEIEILPPAEPVETKKPIRTIEPQLAVDLETEIAEAAKLAVESYQNAVNVIRDLSQNILEMVNSDPKHLRPELWPLIKEKSKEEARLLQVGRESAAKARKLVDELNQFITQDRVPGSDPMKAQALKNSQRVLCDIETAQRQVEKELSGTGLGRNAWAKVVAGREKWKEEILILAPDANLEEKTLNIVEDELGQFALYAYVNIQYYEKELALLEMAAEKQLQEALDEAHDGDTKKLIAVTVADKANEERRKIELDYARKALQLRAECAREIRQQLKGNSEVHLDHLEDSLRLLEAEEFRSHNRRLGELLTREAAAYRMELATILGRVRGVSEGLAEHAQVDQRAQRAQELWAACQVFSRQLESAKPGVEPKPLKLVIKTIDETATDSDQLVKVVVKGIPQEALSRGIYSTPVLRERFLKVEKVARNVSAVGDEGGSLLNLLLSWAQANLLIGNKTPLTAAELRDEPTRVDLLNNYELLARARYWVLRGDLSQALRYMNLLQGLARNVADDWMKEVRLNLECQQAATALVSHATALGMMYS